MPNVGSFDQESLIEHFLAKNCNKGITIFKITTVNFGSFQNSTKKQKCLNLRRKLPYLGIFDRKCLILAFLGKNFKKDITIFEISSLKFLICKIHEKAKKPKFETENPLFGYF